MSSNQFILGKFVIISALDFSDYYKDVDGNLKVFDTYEQAMLHCGFMELDYVYIVMVYNFFK